MGVFGLLYTAFCGGAIIADDIKNSMYDASAKNRGKQRVVNGENPGNTYYDYRGCERDIDTNEFASTEYDYLTGDLWLRHGAPSERVRNLSAEWRQRYLEELRKRPVEGKTVINDINIISQNHSKQIAEWQGHTWIDEYECIGQRYKDIKTNAIYVARRVKMEINNRTYYIDCYMNVKNRHLIRLTDDAVVKCKVEQSIVRTIIDKWNKSIDDGSWNSSGWTKDSGIYWSLYYFNTEDARQISSYTELDKMGRVRPSHPRL